MYLRILLIYEYKSTKYGNNLYYVETKVFDTPRIFINPLTTNIPIM